MDVMAAMIMEEIHNHFPRIIVQWMAYERHPTIDDVLCDILHRPFELVVVGQHYFHWMGERYRVPFSLFQQRRAFRSSFDLLTFEPMDYFRRRMIGPSEITCSHFKHNHAWERHWKRHEAYTHVCKYILRAGQRACNLWGARDFILASIQRELDRIWNDHAHGIRQRETQQFLLKLWDQMTYSPSAPPPPPPVQLAAQEDQ